MPDEIEASGDTGANPANDATATTPEANAGGAPAPDAATSTPQRPDGIPDAFWDDAEGVKWGDLTGRLNTLENEAAERAVREQGVPEKPDGYTLRMPEDLELPEGSKLQIDEDSPLLKSFRDFAHERRMTQEDFDAQVALYARAQADEAKTFEARAAEERKKLGPQARERIDALDRTLTARVGEELAGALRPLLFTAGSIQALEALVRGTRPTGVPTGNGTAAPEFDWNKLSGTNKFEAARLRLEQSQAAKR